MIIFRFTDYSEARGLGTDNLLYAINVFVQKRNLIDPCSTTMIWLCSEDVQIYINTYLIMRALWLAGKTDLILCRDLITDVMGMYSMARYVVSLSHASKRTKTIWQTKQRPTFGCVFFLHFVHCSRAANAPLMTLFYNSHSTHSALTAAWYLYLVFV